MVLRVVSVDVQDRDGALIAGLAEGLGTHDQPWAIGCSGVFGARPQVVQSPPGERREVDLKHAQSLFRVECGARLVHQGVALHEGLSDPRIDTEHPADIVAGRQPGQHRRRAAPP